MFTLNTLRNVVLTFFGSAEVQRCGKTIQGHWSATLANQHMQAHQLDYTVFKILYSLHFTLHIISTKDLIVNYSHCYNFPIHVFICTCFAIFVVYPSWFPRFHSLRKFFQAMSIDPGESNIYVCFFFICCHKILFVTVANHQLWSLTHFGSFVLRWTLNGFCFYMLN